MNLRCTPCGEDTLNNSNSFRKKFDDTESLAISLQHLELSRPILNSLGIDIFENIRVIHCSQVFFYFLLKYLIEYIFTDLNFVSHMQLVLYQRKVGN